MKTAELIHLITELLSANGNLTVEEIQARIEEAPALIQVRSAIKTMMMTGAIKLEERDSQKYYALVSKKSKSSLNEEIVTTPTVVEEPAEEETKPKRSAQSTGRDLTKYKFNGETDLSKGRLALAIIQKQPKRKKAKMKTLLQLFPDEIVRPYGVIKERKEAEQMSKDRKRFFINPEGEIVTLKDGTEICVSNQWTSERINLVIQIAKKQLGFDIKKA